MTDVGERGAAAAPAWAGAEAERRLAQGWVAAAAEANRQALAEAPGDFGLRAQRVRILVRAPPLAEARSAFRDACSHACSVEHLDQPFQLTPIVWEGWPRTAAWLWLRRRLDAVADEQGRSGAIAILALRLSLALRDHDSFPAGLERIPPDPDNALLEDLRRVGAFLAAPCFPEFDRPKVFGIGLSKTGTTSLTRALRLLGLHAMHYTNSITHEILACEDAFLFEALVDTPVCASFETLYHMFPKSKFVYTSREPLAWRSSFEAHYRRHHQTSDLNALAVRLGTRGDVPRALERAPIHASLYGGHSDPLSARRAFEGRVRAFFTAHDPARLLEIDVCGGEGWAKLCPFLRRPAPAQSFPWENRTPPAPG